jgi:hypothetical protein
MNHRKTQLAAAVGAALLVGGTAVQAQALQIQLYGQVNRALMYADDGVQSKIFNVDGQPSSTRFGMTGTSAVMPGLRAGLRFETEFRSNQANAVRFGSETNSPSLGERHFDTWVEGGWGRVNLGQGSGAADGAAESDLSGTGLANGIGVADWAGAIRWRTAAGATLADSVEATINQQDFESRHDRVMYSTPSFGGFQARAGFGYKASQVPGGNVGSDVKEASLWYGGKLGGLGQLAAAIGWSEEDAPAIAGAGKNETIGGSVSWLHGSGLNLTASYNEAKNQVSSSGNNAELFLGKSKFTYLKAGWKVGQHAIAVDWAMGEDYAAAGDESTMYGVGYVWNPIAWAEFYAAYKIHSLDRTGVSLEDITVATLGTRIRF